MAAQRKKALFKARRIVFGNKAAWAICYYHWCRLPLRHWGRIRMCSRYALQVRYDDEFVHEDGIGVNCRHCGLVRYVHKTILPLMWEEALVTAQLQAVTLARMGVSQVQYVDASTPLTPLGVGAGKRARRPVR